MTRLLPLALLPMLPLLPPRLLLPSELLPPLLLPTPLVNRSEQAARRFKRAIQKYDAKQLFFLDETAKDPRDLNRGWGWSILGRKPLHSEGFIGRGTRRSTLAGLDVKGFVNWYTIRGTFNRSKFLEASEAMVVGLPLHAASHRWYHPPLLYATACCCLSWCCPLGV